MENNTLSVAANWFTICVPIIAALFYLFDSKRKTFRSKLGGLLLIFFRYCYPIIMVVVSSIYGKFDKEYVLTVGFYFLWLAASIGWAYTEFCLRALDAKMAPIVMKEVELSKVQAKHEEENSKFKFLVLDMIYESKRAFGSLTDHSVRRKEMTREEANELPDKFARLIQKLEVLILGRDFRKQSQESSEK